MEKMVADTVFAEGKRESLGREKKRDISVGLTNDCQLRVATQKKAFRMRKQFRQHCLCYISSITENTKIKRDAKKGNKSFPEGPLWCRLASKDTHVKQRWRVYTNIFTVLTFISVILFAYMMLDSQRVHWEVHSDKRFTIFILFFVMTFPVAACEDFFFTSEQC